MGTAGVHGYRDFNSPMLRRRQAECDRQNDSIPKRIYHYYKWSGCGCYLVRLTRTNSHLFFTSQSVTIFNWPRIEYCMTAYFIFKGKYTCRSPSVLAHDVHVGWPESAERFRSIRAILKAKPQAPCRTGAAPSWERHDAAHVVDQGLKPNVHHLSLVTASSLQTPFATTKTIRP